MNFILLFCLCSGLVASHGLGEISKNVVILGRAAESDLGRQSYAMTCSGKADGKRFYMHYSMNNIAWNDAVEFCKEKGLRLATIELEAQHELVYKEGNMQREVWFWLNAKRHRGIFHWVPSQSPFDYAGWSYGQPTSRGYDCAYAGSDERHRQKGWFNIVPCETKHRHLFPLCESL